MSFDFILTPDTLIYRSVKEREHLLGEWYGFVPEDTFGYGPITGEFKSLKSLKLLDITKNSFYNNFRDKIIDYSKVNPIINNYKGVLLFPLGFPDTTIYTKFADEIKLPRVSPINLAIELDTQYYGNRSRCSVLQFDLQLVSLLKIIYPEYDGIISPINLPNTIKNGYQHSELCVFDKNNITLIKEIARGQTGGTMKPYNAIPILGAISLDNEYTREYTKVMGNALKTLNPLTNHNLIEQQFVPHILIESSINNNTKSNISISYKKNRKTRKRRNT